jgi:hypothetical protein
MLKDFGNFVKDKGNEFLREGVMVKFSLEEFSNIVSPQLFESEDRNTIVENAYSFYEMGILYEQNKSWFSDESPIYSMTGDLGTVLFKNGSMFIISERTMQAINEGFFDDLSAGWNRVKAVAKQSYSEIKVAAKDTWDVISAGAKKAISFGAKIVSTTKAFITENPLDALVIGLQALSVGAAFLPPPFNLIAPALLAISGGIDVYQGIREIMEGWEKVSDLDISRGEKVKESLSDGIPHIVSGTVALVLGLSEIMEAPGALVGSGAASIAAKNAAKAWESKFLGRFSKNFNGMISAIISDKGALKLAGVVGKDLGKLALKGGDSLTALFVTTIMATCGKDFLGSHFDILLSGIKNLGKFIKFLTDTPKDLSTKLNTFIINANKSDSTMVKVAASALSTFVAPFLKILTSVVNSTIKPMLDRVSNFMISFGTNHRELERLGKPISDSGKDPAYKKLPPKGQKKYTTSKDDMKYIKKIGVVDNGKLVYPGLTTTASKKETSKAEGKTKKKI